MSYKEPSELPLDLQQCCSQLLLLSKTRGLKLNGLNVREEDGIYCY